MAGKGGNAGLGGVPGTAGSQSTAGTGGLSGSPSAPIGCNDDLTSALPELPALGEVTARIMGNRARLRVPQFNGAKDYRAYALPADADVSTGDGLVVRNATYRCAGSTVSERGEPVLEIEWPTVEPGKVVVVEALDDGCPYAGHLAYQAAPEGTFSKPFITPDQARDEQSGELFINGQFEPSTRPQPIARAFVCPEPGPIPSMDFFEDFTNFDEELTTVSVEDHSYEDVYLRSESFDISFQFIEADAWSFGAVDGQLWVAYSDWEADTASKFRATTRRSMPMSDSTFVHATMAVDAISTYRRYPQLWISSAPTPVQNNLEEGVTLNLEPFGGVPDELLLLQICDHQWWDVQEQCPIFYDRRTEAKDELEYEEHTAVALPVRFDLYASTKRAYVFYDSIPVMCADLPEGAFNPGDEVTLTIGDVLYHSGADESIWDMPGPDVYRYHSEYEATETRRVFDDIGFSGGVPAPAWDEGAIPCFTGAYAD
jgi:hypothetical protein